MKKYIAIVTLIIFACSSSHKLLNSTSNCYFKDKISKEEKSIDFDLIKKKFDKNGYYTFENSDSINYYIEYGSKNEYWKRKQNKITEIEKIIIFNTETLKLIGLRFRYNKGNFFIGNEYFYDDKGEISKTIDHNQYKKFPICYKEIINTILTKVGKKYILHNIARDSTKISDNKYSFNWEVIVQRLDFQKDVKPNGFRVDAVTGKIIKEWISIATPD